MLKIDRRNILLCSIAVIGIFLLTKPFIDAPFNDDWSYGFTVRRFLQTGDFHYNGWSEPFLITQTLWGALFCKLFGISFFVLRLSLLPLSSGCVVMIYILSRQAGIAPTGALALSAILATSPIFVPLTTSFMTDVPGLFCILATVSAATFATRSSHPYRWLIISFLCANIGGLTRQIVWVVPMITFPYSAILRRCDRWFCLMSGAYMALTVVTAYLAIHWFRSHLNIVYDTSVIASYRRVLVCKAFVARQYNQMILATLGFLLPALVSLAILDIDKFRDPNWLAVNAGNSRQNIPDKWEEG